MCIVLLKLHALLHLLGHGMFECNTPKLGFLGLLSVDISYKVCIQGLYIYRVKKRFRVMGSGEGVRISLHSWHWQPCGAILMSLSAGLRI